MNIDQATLRSLLDYNPETGDLTWKDRDRSAFKNELSYLRWKSTYYGRKAGSPISSGYLAVKVGGRKGRLFLAHRLIWLWMTGEWPADSIDHINHDRLDNRWANLREVTHAENMKNLARRSGNKSGATGVFQVSQSKKWRAYIQRDGKRHYLGMFSERNEAVTARRSAERELGYHANHGAVV